MSFPPNDVLLLLLSSIIPLKYDQKLPSLFGQSRTKVELVPTYSLFYSWSSGCYHHSFLKNVWEYGIYLSNGICIVIFKKTTVFS